MRTQFVIFSSSDLKWERASARDENILSIRHRGKQEYRRGVKETISTIDKCNLVTSVV